VTLEDWLRSGFLRTHCSSRQEIVELFAISDRDLANCRTTGLDAEWRMAIAYNAALQAATAALAAEGYRPARGESHHWRVIQSLAHTVGADGDTVEQFDRFRKKRNLSAYERSGAVSDQEAEEMRSLAERLREAVGQWIQTAHPELAPGNAKA
jgi:hypothetical protein